MNFELKKDPDKMDPDDLVKGGCAPKKGCGEWCTEQTEDCPKRKTCKEKDFCGIQTD